MNYNYLRFDNLKQLQKFVCETKEFPKDYSPIIREAIYDLSYKKVAINTFGSSKYKALIYAGDIDLIQFTKLSETPRIMKDVLAHIVKKNYIIGDIKAGVKIKHKILLSLIGDIKNGVIVNYKPDEIKEYAKLHNIEELSENIPKRQNITFAEWFDVRVRVHNFLQLRWRPEDIFRGYLIQDGIKYNYRDSILHNLFPPYSLDKIDMYVPDEKNRLTEITNIFDPSNEPFNEEQLWGIKYQIFENLFYKFNLPKAIKRAYSVAREFGNTQFLYKIAPYLVSPINEATSFNTDVNVMLDILKFHELKSVKKVFINHINQLINKMYKYDFFNVNFFIKLLKTALKNMDNDEKFKKILEEFIKKMLNILNFETKKYLKDYDINLLLFLP